MVKTLDDLITHYKIHQHEMAGERDRINSQKINKRFTEADQARFAASFEEARQIARDTVSWLETIKRRGIT